LAHHHKYSIEEIEQLVPYERDIFIDMIIAYNKSVEEKYRLKEMQNKAK
jgi:hypothetical protein